MKGIIYKATSKTSGKCYIGETLTTLEERKYSHEKHASSFNTPKYKFQNAINELGFDDFEWEILEELNALTTKELKKILHIKERYYIKKYNTFENGYNSSRGNYIFSGELNSNFVEITIDKNEYLEFCSHGYNRSEQAKKFGYTPDQIKTYRKRIIFENPELKELLDKYNALAAKRALQKRIDNNNTFTAYGKDNPVYVEINIDENLYIEKAKEGLSRKQIAEYFNMPENHIKIWRRRKTLEDIKYKKLFKELDKYRKRGTAERNKLINRLPPELIDRVKNLLLMGKSMQKISDELNISFSKVRYLKKELI